MFSNKRKFRAKVSVKNKIFWKEIRIDLYRNYTLSIRASLSSKWRFLCTHECMCDRFNSKYRWWQLHWVAKELCSPRHYAFLIRHTPASSLTSASQWLIERVHAVFVTDTSSRHERAKRNLSCHSQISRRRSWIVYGSYLKRRFLSPVFRSRGIWRETKRSRRGKKIRGRERRRRK